MKLALVILAACATAAAILVAVPQQAHAAGFFRANAAWLYPYTGSGPVAKWWDTISAFNGNASAQHQISVNFVYGGDMEYWGEPFTYFQEPAQQNVIEYNTMNQTVATYAVIDGNMDSTKVYAPDLRRLGPIVAEWWANVTAATYCNNTNPALSAALSGIIVQLQPVSGPYVENLMVFLRQLARNLNSTRYGCVDPRYHKQGRSLGLVVEPHEVTQQLVNSMGNNSFLILKGFGLERNPGGLPPVYPPLSPHQFASKLSASLTTFTNTMKTLDPKPFFYLGLPAGASSSEYQSVDCPNGTVASGFPFLTPQPSNSSDYYSAAFGVRQSSGITTSSEYYLGTAVWSFANPLVIPPHLSQQYFYNPSNPTAIVNANAMQFLANNL